MKKVYLVITEHEEFNEHNEKFTDIAHVCADIDLAVEYANDYVNCAIRDSLREEHKGFVWVERQEQSVGKYYSKHELLNGDNCYLAYGDHDTDSIIESYSIKIEEHEVRED